MQIVRFLSLSTLVGGLLLAQSTDATTPGVQPMSPEKLSNRWVSVDKASIGTRLVVADDSSGTPATREFQHQEIFEGALLLDPQAKYSIHATMADGDNIAGGWSNSSIGSDPSSYHIHLKQLYFSAKPLSGIEFQYGGIGVERGTSSAITGYAGDAYLTGGRLLIHLPASLYFDTISFTQAYLGDFNSPGMEGRFHRLQQTNYQQFLLAKQLNKRVSASIDYTNTLGIKTVRESAQISVRELRALDAVHFDVYERISRDRNAGFHVGLEKTITHRLSVSGGYASIDRNYGDLNADAFFHGNRVYAGADLHVTRDFTVSSLFDRAVGNDYAVPNRTHFHLAFNYDLLPAITRAYALVGGHA